MSSAHPPQSIYRIILRKHATLQAQDVYYCFVLMAPLGPFSILDLNPPRYPPLPAVQPRVGDVLACAISWLWEGAWGWEWFGQWAADIVTSCSGLELNLSQLWVHLWVKLKSKVWGPIPCHLPFTHSTPGAVAAEWSVLCSFLWPPVKHSHLRVPALCHSLLSDFILNPIPDLILYFEPAYSLWSWLKLALSKLFSDTKYIIQKIWFELSVDL